MKIATYKDGSRDGLLVVVSRDLTIAHYAAGIAGRLQQVLDDWNFLSPQLQELSQTLIHGKARHAFAFDPRQCMAPLPRAFCLASIDMRPPQSSGGPASVRIRRSDALLGPCAPLPVVPAAPTSAQPREAGGTPQWEVGAELVVITGDLSADAAADDSLAAVRLVTACAIWQPPGADAGDDNASITSFCPVAVTTDELGAAWNDPQHRLPLHLLVDGRRTRSDDAWQPSTRDIVSGLTRCAALRGLRAGSIIGTGVQISASLSAVGGETLRIAADGSDGENLFGAISVQIDAAR